MVKKDWLKSRQTFDQGDTDYTCQKGMAITKKKTMPLDNDASLTLNFVLRRRSKVTKQKKLVRAESVPGGETKLQYLADHDILY